MTSAADESPDQKSDGLGGCYHTRGPTHRLQPHATGPGGGGVYCTVQLYCGAEQHWAEGVLHSAGVEAFLQVCARCSHGKSETSEPKLAGLI